MAALYVVERLRIEIADTVAVHYQHIVIQQARTRSSARTGSRSRRRPPLPHTPLLRQESQVRPAVAAALLLATLHTRPTMTCACVCDGTCA